MAFLESLLLVYIACCCDIYDTRRHVRLQLSSLVFRPVTISLRCIFFSKYEEPLLHKASSSCWRRWDPRQKYRNKTYPFRCPLESNMCLHINRKGWQIIFSKGNYNISQSTWSSTLIINAATLPLRNGVFIFSPWIWMTLWLTQSIEYSRDDVIWLLGHILLGPKKQWNFCLLPWDICYDTLSGHINILTTLRLSWRELVKMLQLTSPAEVPAYSWQQLSFENKGACQ